MARNCRSWLCLAVFFVLLPSGWDVEKERATEREMPCAHQTFHPLSDLRSAFLVRQGSASYDSQRATPEGRQEQLQRHFDLVLALLNAATENSTAKALDRLQTAHGENWTAAQRSLMRDELLAARQLQIERLSRYRDRGLFPQNEGQAKHSVPIFVDDHDTACAVGHLMRESGHEEQVDLIVAADNLVYVPDVAEGPVAEWVLTSGLTQEEAALVQPGYDFGGPPADATLDTLTVPGASYEKDGLRYSNFSFSTANGTSFSFPPELCEVFPEFCGGFQNNGDDTGLPTADRISVTALTDTVYGSFSYYDFELGEEVTSYVGHTYIEPLGTNWLWLSARMARYDIANDVIQQLRLSFDITPLESGKAIDRLWVTESHLIGGFQPYDLTYLNDASTIQLSVSNDGGSLGSITYEDGAPHDVHSTGGFVSDLLEISPQSSITVDIDILSQPTDGSDDGSFGGFALQFNVIDVPEPTSALLAALLGCAGFFWRGCRVL